VIVDGFLVTITAHEAPRRVNGLFESLLVSLSTISQVVPRLRQASRSNLLLHGSGVEGRLAAYETPNHCQIKPKVKCQ